MHSNVLHLPRETSEFVRVEVRVDNVALPATDLDYALTPHQERPTSWSPMTVDDDDKTGFTVEDLTPGEYRIWVRHGETVRFAGLLMIT